MPCGRTACDDGKGNSGGVVAAAVLALILMAGFIGLTIRNLVVTYPG